MPVVVTQAYTGNARLRVPTETASVYNWESDDSQSSVPHIPAIIEFLGYNPLPVATNLAGRLVRHRTSLGLSQSASARLIGVDPGTLARWERGEKQPAGEYLARIERFLAGASAPHALLRRAG